MNRKLLLIASVVAAGAVGAAVFFAARRRPAPTDTPQAVPSGISEHGNGIDQAMGAVNAVYHAPEGATPCETAYNAFKASLDFSTEHPGVTPFVLRLAPRDGFLARCMALPSATQQCMAPTYMAHHRDECAPLKPADDVIAAMVELKRNVDPAPQEPSASPSGSH